MDDHGKEKTKDWWENFWNSQNVGEKKLNFLDKVKDEMEFVLPYLSQVKGKKVLDVGCGAGSLSLLLASNGAIVTAMDITEGAVKMTTRLAETYKDLISEKGGSISAICIDAVDVDRLPGAEFDFIFGNMVLHHIEPLEVFIRKLSAIVKPGGGIGIL